MHIFFDIYSRGIRYRMMDCTIAHSIVFFAIIFVNIGAPLLGRYNRHCAQYGREIGWAMGGKLSPNYRCSGGIRPDP